MQAEARRVAADSALSAAKHARDTYAKRLKTAQAAVEDAARALPALRTSVRAANAKVPPDQRTLFASLPRSLPELQAELASMAAQLGAMLVDSTALAAYETAKAKHARAKAELDTLEANLRRGSDEVVAKVEQWTTKMNVVVSNINRRFEEGMAKLKVTGSVSLDASAARIAEAGIAVRVAFRAGDTPQLLNKEVQSGGERALTTMMFLLAMQTVTPLPFRVVDEINQGMDINNERAVIEQLLSTAHPEGAGGGGGGGGDAVDSGESRGRQLFMITPKLLPDLMHNPAIRSEIVYNGSVVGTKPESTFGWTTARCLPVSIVHAPTSYRPPAGARKLGQYYLNFTAIAKVVTATKPYTAAFTGAGAGGLGALPATFASTAPPPAAPLSGTCVLLVVCG